MATWSGYAKQVQCLCGVRDSVSVMLLDSVPDPKPWGSGEKVVCAAISPRLYILAYMYTSAVLPAIPIAALQLWGISVTVWHVTKIIVAETQVILTQDC